MCACEHPKAVQISARYLNAKWQWRVEDAGGETTWWQT